MAYSLIAHASRATGGSTAAIDTSGANLLVAVTGGSAFGAGAISDSKGNTWYTAAYDYTQSTCLINLWFCLNPTVGSGHTFTVAGSTASMCVAAFSGAPTTFAVGKSRTGNTASATSITAGSMTPGVDDCLAITALGNRVNTTYSVDGSFSITDQVNFNNAIQMGVGLAYLIQTSAAAFNPSWSWTGAGVGVALNAYFRLAPGPAGFSYGYS